MNLVIALDELHKARRIVADGEKCLVEQRKVVDRLESDGCDTLDAIQFLEYLEKRCRISTARSGTGWSSVCSEW